MTSETSKDRPANRESIVAAYSPELTQARDELVLRSDQLEAKLRAMDIVGELPERVKIQDFEKPDVIQITFGGYSDNLQEALVQYGVDKLLGSLAIEAGGGTSASDYLIVTRSHGTVAAAGAASQADSDIPIVRVEWGKFGSASTLNGLSIYRDGYVESYLEATERTMVHPPDANDIVRAYGQPTVVQESFTIPPEARPADLGDIQNATFQVENTVVTYGIQF